jgi:hypothetical protein
VLAEDRVTRFASDLLDAATVEGARHSRSAKQQLDHWARVGRQVSAHQSASRQRVEGVLAGTLPTTALGPEEHLVANAEIDALISERARQVNVGAALAAEGLSTVGLDEQGCMVRYLPDGTTEPVD